MRRVIRTAWSTGCGNCSRIMETELVFEDYRKVEAKLICRLMRKIPGQPFDRIVTTRAFADLYAVPYQYRKRTDGTADCRPLVLPCLRRWGMEAEDICSDAVKNMERLFPAVLEPLESLMQSDRKGSVKSVLLELLKQRMPTVEGSRLNRVAEVLAARVGERAQKASGLGPMWYLGNTGGLYGASSLLYPGVLSAFAKMTKQSFFILPASVHHVILLPENGSESRELLYGMVASGNNRIEEKEKILSGSVYYFDAGKTNIRLF